MQRLHHSLGIGEVFIEDARTHRGLVARIEHNVVDGDLQLAVFRSDAQQLGLAGITEFRLPIAICPERKHRRCSGKVPISPDDPVEPWPGDEEVIDRLRETRLNLQHRLEAVVPACRGGVVPEDAVAL